jgi:hypothetical protein
MQLHLIVTKPFDGLPRGEIITDPTQIATILKGEHAHCVVKVATPSPGGA